MYPKSNDLMDSTADKKRNVDEIRLDPISHIHRENNPQFIASLARGLEVLRCFCAQQKILGNQELAQLTNLPKPTIARITSTLVSLGYLKQLPQSTKYTLDIGVLALGYASLSNISSRQSAHPYMQQLSDYAQAPVAMATRDRLNMLYLDVVQADGNLTMRRPIGSTLPLHNTAMGRACLAAMPDNERAFIMQALEERHQAQWPSIKRGIERALHDYQHYGYCLSLNEWHKEVNAVAVPLVHPIHGLLVFNCGAPSYLLDQQQLEDDIGPRLIAMVAQIKQDLDQVI